MPEEKMLLRPENPTLIPMPVRVNNEESLIKVTINNNRRGK